LADHHRDLRLQRVVDLTIALSPRPILGQARIGPLAMFRVRCCDPGKAFRGPRPGGATAMQPAAAPPRDRRSPTRRSCPGLRTASAARPAGPETSSPSGLDQWSVDQVPWFFISAVQGVIRHLQLRRRTSDHGTWFLATCHVFRIGSKPGQEKSLSTNTTFILGPWTSAA